MSTIKQIDANRRNAQNSTGPRTSEGKAHSAANGLKHGLTATQIVLPSEDAAEFDELAQAFRAEHDPQTPTELILLDQLIAAAWRLRRARSLETGFYERQIRPLNHYNPEKDPAEHVTQIYLSDIGPKSMIDSLARYESRMERSFYRALAELRKLRASRPPSPDPEEANLQNEPNFVPTPIESTPIIMSPVPIPPPGPPARV